MAGPNSERLFARATKVIPGGVNSPVRAFGSVGGTPYFVAEAHGAYVTDVDGDAYIDFVQSWGASILGHAHPVVIDAIDHAARKGTTFGAPTEAEVRLAEAICEATIGVDEVRLVSSGTEAVMTAVRLARAATGRTQIVKFAGCYHGHSDSLLARAGSGVANQGLSNSAGVPDALVADTIVVAYNELPKLTDQVACVLVEPVAANMGLVPPAPGFLEGLRRSCDEVGALLIFDEVITGFRLGRAGAAGHFGVAADLSCFGKVIGGGLPLAGLGGRRSLMEQLAPVGPVYQAGTLSGNPLATAAGLSVLSLLDDKSYSGLFESCARLCDGLEEAIGDAGLPIRMPRVGSLCGIFFSNEDVTNYDLAAKAASNGLYARFFQAMLARHVALAPSPYEIAFVSLAHGEDEIERTIVAAFEAAREIAKSL